MNVTVTIDYWVSHDVTALNTSLHWQSKYDREILNTTCPAWGPWSGPARDSETLTEIRNGIPLTPLLTPALAVRIMAIMHRRLRLMASCWLFLELDYKRANPEIEASEPLLILAILHLSQSPFDQSWKPTKSLEFPKMPLKNKFE